MLIVVLKFIKNMTIIIIIIIIIVTSIIRKDNFMVQLPSARIDKLFLASRKIFRKKHLKIIPVSKYRSGICCGGLSTRIIESLLIMKIKITDL